MKSKNLLKKKGGFLGKIYEKDYKIAIDSEKDYKIAIDSEKKITKAKLTAESIAITKANEDVETKKKLLKEAIDIAEEIIKTRTKAIKQKIAKDNAEAYQITEDVEIKKKLLEKAIQKAQAITDAINGARTEAETIKQKIANYKEEQKIAKDKAEAEAIVVARIEAEAIVEARTEAIKQKKAKDEVEADAETINKANENAKKNESKPEYKGSKVENLLFYDDITSKIIMSNNLYKIILDFLYTKKNTKSNKNIKKIINFLKILLDKDINLSNKNSETQNLLNTPIGVNSNDEYILRPSLERTNIFTEIADEFIEYNNDYSNIKHPNFNNKNLFFKYNLSNKEDKQHFITIDPTIIQIMIFDDEDNSNDIVYSLKLIMRDNVSSSTGNKQFVLRYSTMLFPENSEITEFNNLTDFNNLNKNFGNKYMIDKHDDELSNFFKTSVRFYELYKKCYVLKDKKIMDDYHLKYISILGKARFSKQELCIRTEKLTDYIMSNLLIVNPSYGFISGGYKGFKQNAYGITRSGYEIAKRYNRPILTIMCKEGMHDSHEYSDSLLIYGEHWGEDTIALSQLTDGAVIIAPFGGWTYIECLSLLKQEKIVVIYNDFYNILNYKELSQEEIDDITTDILKKLPNLHSNDLRIRVEEKINNILHNKYFFMFAPSEQNSIIDYYINYYLILMRLHNDPRKYVIFYDKLKKGIEKLSYLKSLFGDYTLEYTKIYEEKKFINKIKEIYIKELKEITKPEVKLFDEEIYIYNEVEKKKIEEKIIDEIRKNTSFIGKEFEEFNKIIFNDNPTKLSDIINILETIILTKERIFLSNEKNIINYIKSFHDIKKYINDYVSVNINAINIKYKEIIPIDSYYQSEIPRSCDGIWIKPTFNFIDDCVKKGEDGNYNINVDYNHKIFTNFNKNIIFVFSDIMYLNFYLNNNLNKGYIQKKIQDKINNIKSYKNKFSTAVKDLLAIDKENIFSLNRSIDGLFNADRGIILNKHILKDDYYFITDETCNSDIIESERFIATPLAVIGKTPRQNKSEQVEQD
jgi:hypothetical protein